MSEKNEIRNERSERLKVSYTHAPEYLLRKIKRNDSVVSKMKIWKRVLDFSSISNLQTRFE